MNRTEYLANRFKRDFLHYSMMQEDSLSGKEIADRLYSAVDLTALVSDGKHQIEMICQEYLSFEKFNVDGQLHIVALNEYQKFLDKVTSGSVVSKALSDIERCVELQTWSNGIANMTEAVSILVTRLNQSARSYANLCEPCISEEELSVRYDKAKEISLLERISGNSINDVVEYRSALMEYVQVSCLNMLYTKIKDIYANIGDSPYFDDLRANYRKLEEFANELKRSIVETEPVEEWEKEYDHKVPTDFYFRNVEKITSEHAFHMVLLQFFARNEDWLIENGMLAEGNLKVYSDPKKVHLEDLLNYMLSK